MVRSRATTKVLKVTGPITLDWGNGVRITLTPAGIQSSTPTEGAVARGHPGRKPSPATQALVSAMHGDVGQPRPRAEYLRILRQAGHKGSDNSAALIINREAKRVFGHPLRRLPRRSVSETERKPGRQASPATTMLRARLAQDHGNGGLKEATVYIRWLVDEADIGIRKARPIVYRELRAAR